MEINKINLDGVEYGLGEAKLVATGEWDSESNNSFLLNNILSPNKYYLLELYCEELDLLYPAFIKVYKVIGVENYISNSYITYIMDEDESENLLTSIFYDYTPGHNDIKIYCEPFDSELSSVFKNFNGICEVYELPITLGGNE